MIKDSFEAKIIKVDGLHPEGLSCKILHNSRQHEDFKPLQSQKSFILSGGGIYTFQFKTGSTYKSVSIRLSLFCEDGAQWLPLFDTNTLIDNLPEETSAPRFLIVLCQSKALHVIEESGEISEDSSLNVSESENILSNGVVYSEVFESIPSELLDQSSIYDESGDDTFVSANNEKLTKIWEKGEIVSRKNSFESQKEDSMRLGYDDLTQKHEKMLNEFYEQIKKNEEYEVKIEKLLKNSKDQALRTQNRESSLIEILNAKDQEIKTAHVEILGLKNKVQVLQIENNRLSDLNCGLVNEINLCNPNPVIAELNILRNQVQELYKQLAANKWDENEVRIIDKEFAFSQLHRTLSKSKPSDFETKESQNASIFIDELEDAVRTQAKLMNLPETLVRDKEQMYLYGNRKISLILVNGGLMCRVGVNFKPFREYMENFVLDTAAVKPIKKRFNVDKNIDCEYDEQNFKKINKSVRQAARTIKTCNKKK